MEPIVNQHLASLARLVDQIEQHNDQYSLGQQLGRALSRVLAKDEADPEDMGATQARFLCVWQRG